SRRMRHGEPHRYHRSRHDHRIKRDPWFAAAAAIGDGAQERREDGYDDAAVGLDLAGKALSAHAVSDDVVREVWGEQINRDEEYVGVPCPLECCPRHLAQGAGDLV